MKISQRTSGGSWSYRFQLRNQEYSKGGFPTEASARDAGDRRKARLEDTTNVARNQLLEIIDRATTSQVITAEQIEQVQAILLPTTVATSPLGKILDTYDTATHLDASGTTRTANINAILNILRTVTGFPNDQLRHTDARTLLTSANARAWFDHHATRANTLNQSQARAIKETANSTFNSAAGILTPKARQTYADAGLQLPDTTKFLDAYQANRFRLPRKDYSPPSEEIIQATLDAWATLDDRNLFLAIGYSLAYGLRKGEIIKAKWDWHTTRRGFEILDAAADVKNSTGTLTVKALDPYHTTLITTARNKHWRQATGPILTGSATETGTDVWRRLSEFLKHHGWTTRKKAHALRAYAGSAVAMRYGLPAARDFLRHATSKITEENYSHFVDQFSPEDPTELPWSWSRTTDRPRFAAVA